MAGSSESTLRSRCSRATSPGASWQLRPRLSASSRVRGVCVAQVHEDGEGVAEGFELLADLVDEPVAAKLGAGPASGSFMARRKSSVMASMFRCTPSWLPVMAATRAAAMWPAVLIGSPGWPARWGAGVGVVFVSASFAGALPVQAVAGGQPERDAGSWGVVLWGAPGCGRRWAV